MKRMSEVLVRELPVSSKELLHVMINESSLEDDDAIAHAINNVDALADALMQAIPALQWNRSNSDASDKIYMDAVLALQAYRGTK